MNIIVEGVSCPKKLEYAENLAKELNFEYHDFETNKLDRTEAFMEYLKILTNGKNNVINKAWISDIVNDMENATNIMLPREFAILSNTLGMSGGFIVYTGVKPNDTDEWLESLKIEDVEKMKDRINLYEKTLVEAQMYSPILDVIMFEGEGVTVHASDD